MSITEAKQNRLFPFNITNFREAEKITELEIWGGCFSHGNCSHSYCFELVCGDKGFKFTVYPERGLKPGEGAFSLQLCAWPVTLS